MCRDIGQDRLKHFRVLEVALETDGGELSVAVDALDDKFFIPRREGVICQQDPRRV